jgi:hypothetical protein
MRNNIILLLYLLACPFLCAADFSLVRVNQRVVVTGDLVTLRISTAGPPPPDVAQPSNWVVQATDLTTHESTRITRFGTQGQAMPVRYEPATKQVVLDIDRTLLPTSLAGLLWDAVFLGNGKFLASSSKAPESGTFKEADGRDDADLYLSGSFLTGQGTSPIWMIDAKGTIAFPAKAKWRFGVMGDIKINPDTKAPVAHTEVNPDSISVYGQIDGTIPKGSKLIYGYRPVFKPIGKEYAADKPDGNVMTAGQLTALSRPKYFGSDALVLDPVLGYEIGENTEKPATLFNRPVDLSRYNHIRRTLAGATATYYIFQPEAEPDYLYRWTFSFAWQARVLFADEPFVRSVLLPDDTGKISAQKILSMRRNPRHNINASVTWNLSKLFGLQAQYSYGSLPPLFEFVRPQVTIGLTFKTKYRTADSLRK